MTRRKFEASFRYAPFGFKFLPTVHSFWVFFDCTFLDNSRELEKQNAELQRANEILQEALGFFAKNRKK